MKWWYSLQDLGNLNFPALFQHFRNFNLNLPHFFTFWKFQFSRTFWRLGISTFPHFLTFWEFEFPALFDILGNFNLNFSALLCRPRAEVKIVRENSTSPNPVISITISYILCALVLNSIHFCQTSQFTGEVERGPRVKITFCCHQDDISYAHRISIRV